MSITLLAIALSTLVLWTAGQRTDAEAQQAWAALIQGGVAPGIELPGRAEWVKHLVPLEGGQAWSMASIAAALGPLGIFAAAVAGNDEAMKEVASAAEAATTLAEEKVEEVKTGYGLLIGIGAVVVLGGAIAVGFAVHNHRKKKQLARAA